MLHEVAQTRRQPRQAKPGTPPGKGGAATIRGQPPFVATAGQRVQVRRLVACGFTIESISVITEIPHATLERHFRFELTNGKLMTDAKILGGIVTMAEEGDKTMSIFWARAKAGWKHAGEGQGENAAAAAFTINISNASSPTNGGMVPSDSHTITIEARPEPEDPT